MLRTGRATSDSIANVGHDQAFCHFVSSSCIHLPLNYRCDPALWAGHLWARNDETALTRLWLGCSGTFPGCRNWLGLCARFGAGTEPLTDLATDEGGLSLRPSRERRQPISSSKFEVGASSRSGSANSGARSTRDTTVMAGSILAHNSATVTTGPKRRVALSSSEA